MPAAHSAQVEPSRAGTAAKAPGKQGQLGAFTVELVEKVAHAAQVPPTLVGAIEYWPTLQSGIEAGPVTQAPTPRNSKKPFGRTMGSSVCSGLQV